MLVLLLFFCSGATALVYEVLWSRYLTLILGSTVQAQTVVLAVFMGGLAAGNRLFGARSRSIANPVLAYGVLEMIIGIYAFFFPNLYDGGDFLYVALGSKVANFSALLFALKLALSAGLLLIPTVLMGGTLPLLAAWIQKQSGFDQGARVGIFYATNSLGAVLGAGLAGFWLVQRLGMVSSLEITGLANVGVGTAALVIGKRESLRGSPAPKAADESPAPAPATTSALPGIPSLSFGLLVALTGGVSMGLEVVYSRALALIAGGSVQAFALVLMSFILGIGLGSVAISSARAARAWGLNTIYVLLLIAAATVVINVMYIEGWAILYSHAKFGLATNEVGYIWHELAVAIISFVVLGIPAAFLGAVVPLSIQFLEREGGALGDQVGRLLTANTIGAVVGVLVTGFVLMPAFGLRGALSTLGFGLVALAATIAFQRQQSRVMMTAVIFGAVAILGVANTGDRWRHVMNAGIFRVRNRYITQDWINQRKSLIELQFYKDSADATVSVERSGDPYGSDGQLILRINGKADATSRGDLSTQYLLAHLPMMARPDAKKAFVLGFGSGITAGALLGHPLEQVTIAENARPVLEAGHLFGPWNNGVLTNSRTRIFVDDARSVLKLHPDRYDVIISEPSNPWVAGIGSVFSQEFYQLAASRLTEGGVMAQWFHKYEMDNGIVFLILRTFASVFPNVELWDPQDGDIIMLGSMKPWPSNPAQYQKIFERPGPRDDLRRIGLNIAANMWIRQIASQKTAFAIAGAGPVQTDEFPLLEYNAPRAFFMAEQANEIYSYDERTLQWPLDDPDKIAVLRALPDRSLLETFSYYGTANPDLRKYGEYLVDKNLGAVTDSPPATTLIVFRPPGDYADQSTVRTNTSPLHKQCLQLYSAMLREPNQWRESAEQLMKVLTDMVAANNLLPPDFRPSFFAEAVTRFAIGHKEDLMALEALRLGFIFSVEDPQLLYLSRVMDRQVDPDLLKHHAEKQAN